MSYLEDRRVRMGILTLLCIAAIVSICRGIYYALIGGKDLQWSPAVIFWEQKDPFLFWLSGNQGQKIILCQAPNYLHHYYILLWPFAQLDFETAKMLWVVVNMIVSVFSLLLLKRCMSLSWQAFFLMSSLFFMSWPFRNTLDKGQTGLFVLSFLSAYWFSNNILRGGWLGVGIIKYSFAPVFVFLAILRKESALLVAMLLLIASILFFGYYTDSLSLQLVFEPLLVASTTTAPGMSDLMSLMRYDLGLNFLTASVVSIVSAFFVAIVLRRSKPDGQALAAICVASLLFFSIWVTTTCFFSQSLLYCLANFPSLVGMLVSCCQSRFSFSFFMHE